MPKDNVRERIGITREELVRIELDILDRRHIERYALVRQWLYGVVLDCACGVGYGTYLSSLNPDVTSIIGVDKDADAIEHAKKEFGGDKIKYHCLDATAFSVPCDTFLCIETLEHLREPKQMADLAKRCGAKQVIVSYPSKKTTHYNPHHFWDFKQEQVDDIFNEYELSEAVDLWHEIKVLRFFAK